MIQQISESPWLRLALIVIVAVVAQMALVSDLRISDATGDVMLLIAITAGLAAGPDRGAIAGFVAGCVFDSVLQTPFGLSALAYCIVGHIAGRITLNLLRPIWWMPHAVTFGLSAFGVVVYAIVSVVLRDGDVWGWQLLDVVLVVACLNAVLARPALRMLRWTFGVPAPRPVLR